MPQPTAIRSAPDSALALLTAAQRRIERAQAEALSNPNGQHRRRNLAEMAGMVDAELDALERAGSEWIADQLPEVYAAGARASGFEYRFGRVNRDAVAAIVDRTHDELLTATTFMRADTKRWIQETSRRLQGGAYLDRTTPKQLARQFAELGPRAATDTGAPMPISAVVYKDGSRRSLESYGEMLFRTETALAYQHGIVRNAVQYGCRRFEGFDGPSCGLTSHSDPTKAHGLIVTAEIALQHAVAHPNCQRSWGARPDLDPTSASTADVGRDVGGYDPSTTASQRADQLQAETEAAGLVRRRQARTARTARVSRNTAAREAQQAAARAAAEAEAAKAAAEQIEAARRRALAQRRAQRTKTQKQHARLLDGHGITADQLNAARSQLAGIRSQLRVDAAQLHGDLAHLVTAGHRIRRIPAKKKLTDPNTGRVYYRRGAGGEWDWFDELDPQRQSHMRSRMTADRGALSPDELESYYPVAADQEDAILRWVDEVERIDAAKLFSQGRTVGYYDVDRLFREAADSQLAADLADRGVSIATLWGDDTRAAAHLAQRDQDYVLRWADEIFQRRTGRPVPWEMSTADYATELAAYDDPRVADLMARVAGGHEPATAAERFVIDRWAELVPDGLDLEVSDIAGTHDQIMHLARQADLDGLRRWALKRVTP